MITAHIDFDISLDHSTTTTTTTLPLLLLLPLRLLLLYFENEFPSNDWPLQIPAGPVIDSKGLAVQTGSGAPRERPKKTYEEVHGKVPSTREQLL